jgi:hypothetical protein
MRGRSIRFSLCRRVVDDGLHFAKQMPTVPVERRMDLSRLRIAVREVDNAPNWSAIFLKGFALVARALVRLDEVLNNEILNEIRTGAASTPAKPCNLTTEQQAAMRVRRHDAPRWSAPFDP